jgi:hypothetical protein
MQELEDDIVNRHDIQSCRSWSTAFVDFYTNKYGNETLSSGLAPSDLYFEWLDEFLLTDGRGWYNAIENTSLLSATSITGGCFQQEGPDLTVQFATLLAAMLSGAVHCILADDVACLHCRDAIHLFHSPEAVLWA